MSVKPTAKVAWEWQTGKDRDARRFRLVECQGTRAGTEHVLEQLIIRFDAMGERSERWEQVSGEVQSLIPILVAGLCSAAAAKAEP